MILPTITRRTNATVQPAGTNRKPCSILMLALAVIALVLAGCGGNGPLPPSDTTPPSVISVVPAIGTQNVPVNSSVIITFSESMDASSVNEQTITLSTGNSNVQGSVTCSGTTAVFKPASNLNPKTTYTVAIDASVKDAAGNAMNSPFGYIFFTEIVAQQDTTPPRVIDVQPSKREMGVNTSTAIVIMFSESMDPTTLTNLTTLRSATIKVSTLTGDIPGKVTPLGAAAIFKPDSALNYSTDYAIVVTTNVTDLAENPMKDAFVSSFRTGTVNDNTPPSVVTGSVIPASSGSTTISVNTPISVSFSKPINAATITLSSFIVSDGSTMIPGDIKYYGTTAVFTPTNPLASSTSYNVKITTAVADLSGNKMSADYSWSFTTEPHASDIAPPEVLFTYPTSNQNNVPVYRQVIALLSETMLVSSITPTTFSLEDQNKVPVQGQITSSGALAVFTPTQPLAYNTTYTAMMTIGATDNAGNPLASTYAWSFSTEAINIFTIQATSGANGSISPSGSVSVNIGSSKTFTIAPSANYHVADVLVDGASVGAVTTYTFNNVTADHTISASFAIDTKTITAIAGANGSISPSGSVAVNYGASQTFTITPDTGYQIASVTGCGGTLSSNSYTTGPVTADCAVTASFAINTYTITATAGANGSISPANRIVSYNTTTSFTVTPNPTYHIASVTGCGGSLSGNTYTTGPITGSCTVSASFAVDTHVLTVTKAGTGIGNVTANSGTLAWSGSIGTATYDSGTSITLTAVSDVSSTFTGWSGEGCSGTGTCVVSMTAARNVTAIFTIKTFTITASAGANGSISPSGAVTVNYGASQTFTITPATGYYISAVTVDGVLLTGPNALPNTYTFTNVTTATHSIAVDFSLGSYTITATSGTGGTISPSGTVLVSYNGNRAFTIASNAGYHIVEVLVDDVSIGAQSSYTFTSVKDNHTISASFAVNSTSTSISSSLNPSTYGVSVTFTAAVTSAFGTPTGTVAFNDGGSLIGTGTLSGGMATLSISTLSAGPHSITAVYNGDGNFATSTSSPITQTVNQANQATLMVVSTPSTVAYGSTSALSTSGGSGTGAVTYSAGASTGCSVAGNILSVTNAGGTCSVTATKAADTNYTTITSAALLITLSKANPIVTAWPTASDITYGQTLADSTLTSGSAAPAGTFTFTTPTIAPNVGMSSQGVTFTPSDTTNYNTVTGSVNVTVGRANPIVTVWPTASDITYGQTLASSTLTGGLATPAGTFTFTTPSTTPNTGTTSQSVTFTPADTTNYNTATGSVSVTVNKATPTINWSNPAAITYGTALSGTQLNATVSPDIPGSFAYMPASGTVLDVGDQTLSATFTPTDTNNYNTPPTASVVITVNKVAQATLNIVAPASLTYSSTAILSATGGSGTGAETYDVGGSTGCSVAGDILSVIDVSGTCLVTATKAADNNYNATTSAAATVTLIKANPTVTEWPTASSITYGQTLADSTLTGGTSTPPGTFAFTAPDTIPSSTSLQEVIFTPNDMNNYNTTIGTVSVTVN